MAVKQYIYTDESGTQGNARYCLIAGYRGSPGQWRTFNTEWNKALSRHGATEAFHSNHFWNRERWTGDDPNQFIGWSEERADALLSDLLETVTGHRINAIGCAVHIPAFKRLKYGEQCQLVGYVPKGRGRRKARRPAPYHLAMNSLLSIATQNTTPSASIHFKIAHHPEYSSEAVQSFWDLKDYGEDTPQKRQLKGMEPLQPEEAPGLQAADLLCHLWYRWIQHGGQIKVPVREQQAYARLTHRRSELRYWYADDLERGLALASPKTRAAFAGTPDPKKP